MTTAQHSSISQKSWRKQAPALSRVNNTAASLTTELLDLIFSHLDHSTLAHVTSLVCRSWFASSRPQVYFGVRWTTRQKQSAFYEEGILLAPLNLLKCQFERGASDYCISLFDLVERHSRTPTPPATFKVPNRHTRGTARGTLQKLILSGELTMMVLEGILSRLRLEIITTFHIVKLVPHLYNWHVLLDIFPNLNDLCAHRYECDDIWRAQQNPLDLDNLERFKPQPAVYHSAAIASTSTPPYSRPLVSLTLFNVSCYPIELKNVLRNCPKLQKLHIDFDHRLWSYDRKFYRDFFLNCPLVSDLRITKFSFTSAGLDSFLDLLSGDLTSVSLPPTSMPSDIYAILARQCPRLEELEIFSGSMYSMGASETLKTLQAYLTSPDAQRLKSLRVLSGSFYADNFDINKLQSVETPALWNPNPGTFYSPHVEGHMVEDPNSDWCRAGKPPRRIPAVQIKEVWTCRFLETLHLKISERSSGSGPHASDEGSRILFGFISKALPLLRDLYIERYSIHFTIEGGGCLLTRLHFLEKLVLQTTYESNDNRWRERGFDRKKLAWIQKFPSRAQRLAWVLKAKRLKMQGEGFRKDAKSPAKDPVEAVAPEMANSETTKKEASSDITARMEDSGTIPSPFMVTKEDMVNCGYMDDVVELLEERSRAGFNDGKGCWPRLRVLRLRFYRYSYRNDVPEAWIHKYRPELVARSMLTK
ncbi:hypothetical protein EMPS_03666 [Entomortierella parvispora]|uniref:F-box domain-containing protein n=1 Tax=Entomortierella parvispora TaxID=205924 RepID=A0A9P3H734_9FUNG|nr:hypothetical protein EMPS_03666 [Entomortierella parvispora]